MSIPDAHRSPHSHDILDTCVTPSRIAGHLAREAQSEVASPRDCFARDAFITADTRSLIAALPGAGGLCIYAVLAGFQRTRSTTVPNDGRLFES
jgi:hypothetical protein